MVQCGLRVRPQGVRGGVEMRILRFKEKFIPMIRDGTKTMTTRMVARSVGYYSLRTGARYAPVDSGIDIVITSKFQWKKSKVSMTIKDVLAHKEGLFSSFDEFWNELVDINKKKLPENADDFVWTTHVFHPTEDRFLELSYCDVCDKLTKKRRVGDFSDEGLLVCAECGNE